MVQPGRDAGSSLKAKPELVAVMAARVPSSFRDPSGFVFEREGRLYRQISSRYAGQFRKLVECRFLDKLVEERLLIPFEIVSREEALTEDADVVIRPDRVPTISYPYEWCFDQLRDAALATLEIQRLSLESGFTLRDATAYNIQFHRGKPTLIDTLSFEDLAEGAPWRAYRQFCQHFLAPLCLAAYLDPRLIALSQMHLDGIPLDLATKMLPNRAHLNSGVAIHLLMHAKANANQDAVPRTGRAVGKHGHLALVDSLRRTVAGLKPPTGGTEWSNYYSETNYSESAQTSKRAAIAALLNLVDEPVATCWDLGANNGEYSRLALEKGWHTVAWDMDHSAVSAAYAYAKRHGEANLLPLVQNFASPSPRIGWNLAERESLADRGPADIALALALVHHLAIGNNVPLTAVAEFLSTLGRWVVIEFVPKEDSQVQRMLKGREDIFDRYNLDEFERAFSERFETIRCMPIRDSLRSVHLLRRRA